MTRNIDTRSKASLRGRSWSTFGICSTKTIQNLLDQIIFSHHRTTLWVISIPRKAQEVSEPFFSSLRSNFLSLRLARILLISFSSWSRRRTSLTQKNEAMPFPQKISQSWSVVWNLMALRFFAMQSFQRVISWDTNRDYTMRYYWCNQTLLEVDVVNIYFLKYLLNYSFW